ncbi:TetR family transcriptional regulator C-terminal domain-containing protein [Maribacter litoralis]|uniref:TetR/AcrR family transcriptional regulator n=1 Tax=Maribacter litoralis TaxID=2059726 RepID=UPI003F5CC032
MKTEIKDKILNAGVNIIAKKGYNGIGIQEILNEVNIPKGSFYHYFKSKEDFGIQVIKKYTDDSLVYINSFLENTNLNPLQRIYALFYDVQKAYIEKEFKEGCLLGNCSTELGGQKINVSTTLENEFMKMENIFSKCIEEAQVIGQLNSNNSPDELASFIVNGWEGAILRMKSSRNIKPMKTFIELLKTKILN